MAAITLSDLVYGSQMATAPVTAIFTEIENYLNGVTPADFQFNGNISQPLTGYRYIGSVSAEGSYREYIDSNGIMVIEKLVSGTWRLCSAFDYIESEQGG